MLQPQLDEPLGTAAQFKWHTGAGANIKPAAQAPITSANMYAALDNIESDRRISKYYLFLTRFIYY